MKILIAGCGYVGKIVGKTLLDKGHEVWGLRRDTASLDSTGIRPVKADMNDPATLKNLPKVDWVVFCQAPTSKTDDYRQTYARATRNLLEALTEQKLRKVIFISSTSVYGQRDGSWVDEKTDTGAQGYESPEARMNAFALLEAECRVTDGKFKGMVLRLGGIYGPGKHRLRPLREGKMKPAISDLYTNRIHVDDIVAAIRVLLDKGKEREVYLGADDYPCTQKEFYSWICEKLDVGVPLSSGQGQAAHGSNKRCSNKKLKSLGWKPVYPTYKEGYRDLIKEAL